MVEGAGTADCAQAARGCRHRGLRSRAGDVVRRGRRAVQVRVVVGLNVDDRARYWIHLQSRVAGGPGAAVPSRVLPCIQEADANGWTDAVRRYHVATRMPTTETRWSYALGAGAGAAGAPPRLPASIVAGGGGQQMAFGNSTTYK